MAHSLAQRGLPSLSLAEFGGASSVVSSRLYQPASLSQTKKPAVAPTAKPVIARATATAAKVVKKTVKTPKKTFTVQPGSFLLLKCLDFPFDVPYPGFRGIAVADVGVHFARGGLQAGKTASGWTPKNRAPLHAPKVSRMAASLPKTPRANQSSMLTGAGQVCVGHSERQNPRRISPLPSRQSRLFFSLFSAFLSLSRSLSPPFSLSLFVCLFVCLFVLSLCRFLFFLSLSHMLGVGALLAAGGDRWAGLTVAIEGALPAAVVPSGARNCRWWGSEPHRVTVTVRTQAPRPNNFNRATTCTLYCGRNPSM